MECGERNIKVTIFGKNEVLSVKLAKMVAWILIEGKVLSLTTQIGYGLDLNKKEWLHFLENGVYAKLDFSKFTKTTPCSHGHNILNFES